MNKLPQTDSIAALARFWDTHDVTEFEDELEEVARAPFDPERCAVIPVPLPIAEAAALKGLARARGVEEGDLIREWVREKLRAC